MADKPQSGGGRGGRRRTTWTKENPPPKRICKGRRPIPPDVKAACKELTALAVQTLEDAAKKGGSVGVKAAEIILERGHGRVPQSIDVSASVNDARATELARGIALRHPELWAEFFPDLPAPDAPLPTQEEQSEPAAGPELAGQEPAQGPQEPPQGTK